MESLSASLFDKDKDIFQKAMKALSNEIKPDNPETLKLIKDKKHHDKILFHERNNDMCTNTKKEVKRWWIEKILVLTGSAHINK